ncbi:hypothetical protein K435DRAFT_791890 [Dendrothele bispora CBS 962.96]|uniref:DUF6532 domain-containing protein n=1 Tax=Dendrothele bispora (strain CBS 962.96) TaxID=1314807 RepID=A0A4S8MK21_DENBC|nr:hypothetical protein K435DRAFT_791890 [Dendrothele bispora CBS 962.96]
MAHNTRATSKQHTNMRLQQKRKNIPDASGPPPKKKKESLKKTSLAPKGQKSRSVNNLICPSFKVRPAEQSDEDCQIKSEDDVVPAKHLKSVAKKAPKTMSPQEEDTEEDKSGSNEESDEDRDTDYDAINLIDSEAPVFVNEIEHPHSRSFSRTSTYTDDDSNGSVPPSTNPPTDTEGHLVDFDEDDIEYARLGNSVQRYGSFYGLKDLIDLTVVKLPQVVNQPLQPVRSVTAPTPAPAPSNLSLAPQNEPWLQRTNIVTVLKGRTTVLASLSSQSKPIRDLFDKAIKIGKLKMITGSRYCPVNPDSLKSIADAALESACERLEFTQTNDIRDRLRDGDYNTYARVFMSYVAQRIGLERKDLKTTQVATVLASFGFGNNMEHRNEAQHLLLNYTYHYATLPSGQYDNSKPFEHPVLSQYIGVMFFGNNLYSKLLAVNKQVFVSSIPQKPDELELPLGLVALSVATVISQIHSILQDYARSCSEHFPSKELTGVWKSALGILENIKRVNRLRYHVLMHKLYINASGTLPLAQHGLTNEQILNAVDWAAFAEAPDSV